jgi:hypothetical protein
VKFEKFRGILENWAGMCALTTAYRPPSTAPGFFLFAISSDMIAASRKLELSKTALRRIAGAEGGNMAIVMRFTSPGLTAEKYEETVKRLEEAGAGAPPGRLYHVCFGDKENLRVSDIWDSRESFDKFGETLVPILNDLGIALGNPDVLEVYNIIEGEKATSAKR